MFLCSNQYQFPVGQGGLHLTQLYAVDCHDMQNIGKPYSIVFDCGGHGNASSLKRSLSLLKTRLFRTSSHRMLDVLVLSHLHRDHINGFEQLIGTVPLRIDRLIMPHYDEVDQAILLAQIASETNSLATLTLIAEVVADPGRWFGERGVREVIQVVPGSGETTTAPDGTFDPADGPRSGPAEDLSRETRESGMRVEDRVTEVGGRAGPSGSRIVENQSFLQMIGVSASGLLPPSALLTDWTLVPYSERHVPGRSGHRNRQQMKREVDRALAGCRNADGSITINPNQAQPVLAALQQAYVDYTGNARNWNAISLSLFNGLTRKRSFYVAQRAGAVEFSFIDRDVIDWWPILEMPWMWLPHIRRTVSGHAWMHTGDADLNRNAVAWDAFYQKLLPGCSMFQLPHHGSKNNLTAHIALPRDCIGFATCRPNDEKHPDPTVVQGVNNQGIEVLNVDTHPASAITTLVVAKLISEK